MTAREGSNRFAVAAKDHICWKAAWIHTLGRSGKRRPSDRGCGCSSRQGGGTMLISLQGWTFSGRANALPRGPQDCCCKRRCILPMAVPILVFHVEVRQGHGLFALQGSAG